MGGTTTPDEQTDRWLSYKDAAAFSGLGRTTLWRLAATGQVHAAKVGTAVRFSRKSLQEFMERSSYSELK